jgi:hypothetical protein
MEKKRTDRVLVVDDEEQPAGAFSLAGLALEIADERMAGAVVRRVREAFRRRR